MTLLKKNPYHIEIIGKAIGHANVIAIEYAPVLSLDLTKGNIFEIVLKGNLTIHIAKMLGGRSVIIFKQDSVGSHTVTYPDQFKFMDGFTGAPSSTANSINILDCINDPEEGEIFATMTLNYQ